MQYGGDEPAPGRNRRSDRARRTRGASRRSGRLASVGPARHAAQHHLDPVAGEVSGAQSAGKRLAVPARQLALKPNLQILRRRRRPLLRGLEQPRRSTLADHVHRPSQLGPWVLINESWYKAAPDERGGNRHAQPNATAPHLDPTYLRHRPMSRVDINRPSEIGSASQFGEPPFEVQGLGSLRFAVPAKRKTALRR